MLFSVFLLGQRWQTNSFWLVAIILTCFFPGLIASALIVTLQRQVCRCCSGVRVPALALWVGHWCAWPCPWLADSARVSLLHRDFPCQILLSNLIYADQPCLLPADLELGGGCCLLIKTRLPREVCDQANSSERHVTFCHRPFGISSHDFVCLSVSFDPVDLLYCLFSVPQSFGEKYLLAHSGNCEIKG